MKTKMNFCVLVIVLMASALSCKKEEIIAPEKLFIGKWKVTSIAEYKNSSDLPVFNLSRANSAQKYSFEITQNKFFIIDITSNNKVVGETIYFFKDGLFYGAIDGYVFLGSSYLTIGRKVTFEGNNKMLMRVPYGNSSVAFDEYTYSRIQ